MFITVNVSKHTLVILLSEDATKNVPHWYLLFKSIKNTFNTPAPFQYFGTESIIWGSGCLNTPEPFGVLGVWPD